MQPSMPQNFVESQPVHSYFPLEADLKLAGTMNSFWIRFQLPFELMR